MIRAIAAIDDKRGIAAAGHPPYDIPWDIPTDQKYYKDKTAGGIVVMGRSTYETFDEPLPNRRNIIVSNSLNEVKAGFELVNNLDDFLTKNHENDIWIIGGAGIYAAALDYCEELYLTHVIGDYGCDTFFPKYTQAFHQVWQDEIRAENGHQFYFAMYQKTGEPA